MAESRNRRSTRTNAGHRDVDDANSDFAGNFCLTRTKVEVQCRRSVPFGRAPMDATGYRDGRASKIAALEAGLTGDDRIALPTRCNYNKQEKSGSARALPLFSSAR